MKTFVVIGMGRFGSAVALKLFNMGHEVLIIDESEAVIQKLSASVTHAVAANAKDAATLRSLDVGSYDCAVLGIAGNIEDSVLITLALKELGMKEIVCKARDAQHKKILEKIGATQVIIPEHEMGVKTAVKLGSKNLLDFIELTDSYGISELNVPAQWVGKTIEELDVRRKYGVNVIAIKNQSNTDINGSPSPEYTFGHDDVAVMMGGNESISALGML